MRNSEQLSLTKRVYGLLKQSDLPATLTIEKCASSLAMSMTSFRRKLSNEETSYKHIQSKFLNECCIRDLLEDKIKIDDLFIKLGYSERATFERSFRQKFGVSPSQFRKSSLIGNQEKNKQDLTQIAQNIPPLAASCQQLLDEKDNTNIDRVTQIVESDPIYSGRIMGLASKAIYGKTPKNVHEAISRNLGINTIINLAIIFAVKDMLHTYVEPKVINNFTAAFLKAPKLFQLVRKSVDNNCSFNIELTEKVLTLGLLGVFLLSHKGVNKHSFMLYSLQGIDDLHTLNLNLTETMGANIFSASSMMLSLWSIDAELIKYLMALNKTKLTSKKLELENEVVLFMLSCIYASGANGESSDDLSQQAIRLNINNYDAIKELMFSKEA